MVLLFSLTSVPRPLNPILWAYQLYLKSYVLFVTTGVVPHYPVVPDVSVSSLYLNDNHRNTVVPLSGKRSDKSGLR